MSPERPPRFPGLPEGYWSEGLNPAGVHAFLQEVSRWRERMTEWSGTEHARRNLSRGLIDFLLWTLGTQAGGEFDSAHYPVSGFPEDAGGSERFPSAARAGAADYALEVLIWRALVVHFLADVWDTIGPPLFDMEECAAATELFMPDGHDDARACPYCLQEYGAGDAARHHAACPIQQNALLPRWDEAE